jgi:hypothetical protein
MRRVRLHDDIALLVCVLSCAATAPPLRDAPPPSCPVVPRRAHHTHRLHRPPVSPRHLFPVPSFLFPLDSDRIGRRTGGTDERHGTRRYGDSQTKRPGDQIADASHVDSASLRRCLKSPRQDLSGVAPTVDRSFQCGMSVTPDRSRDRFELFQTGSVPCSLFPHP